MRDECGNGRNCGKNGRGNSRYRGDRHRNLDEGVALLILDDDAADVAFVDQLLDFLHEALGLKLDLFVADFPFRHLIKPLTIPNSSLAFCRCMSAREVTAT